MPLGLDRSDRTQKSTCELCCERAICKQDRRSAVSAGITQTIFASRLKSRPNFDSIMHIHADCVAPVLRVHLS
jgi:hypothetical protein